LKVLQVAHYYGSLGGIERVVYQFCHALKGFCDVEALVSSPDSQTTHSVEEGIPVTRVARVAHVNRMSICPTFPLWMRKKKPDLVHIHMINPLAEMSFLLSGLRCKAVATYHMDLSRQRILSWFYTPLQRRFLDRVEAITTSSERFARSSPVLTHYSDKVRILPYGIAESRFQETEEAHEAARRLFESIPGKLVLFVGRLTHYKGLDVLVEAMRHVDATCFIVGSGYLERRLQQLVSCQSLEKKVRICGRVSDMELCAYYERADVFVLPSISRTESYGLTLLEAMSRGTPLVCTELGTGTTFINQDGKTGFVVPPNDPESLADAVNRILTDDALRKTFSQNAKERFLACFSERTMVERLRSLYEEILGNN